MPEIRPKSPSVAGCYEYPCGLVQELGRWGFVALVSCRSTPMVRCAGILILAVMLAGCFYPPRERPLLDSRSSLIVHSPYYKVWDAVHEVLAHGDYRIVNENPDQGIIEAQAAGSFTLADADCGKLRAVAGKYNAEPDPNASALYDFQIEPRGNESSSVSVQGTFTTPVHVPLHPVRGGQCVSKGTQEARLLSAIAQRIHEESSPAAQPALMPPPARETVK
jgi:hypothetical protein